MPIDQSNIRLPDLLIDPREAPEVEIKNWLDLLNDNDAKAILAKAVIAIANHGGGFILLGLTETSEGVVEAPGRPPSLNAYSQDTINGIVGAYADPAFHCAVHLVSAPTGGVFPVVVVPGGHRVPVRAKRSGPHGNIVQQNLVYVRKPGPRSEPPQNSQEWDGLFARVMDNRRDELFERIRDLVTGAVPAPQLQSGPEKLDVWVERSLERWRELTAQLPADDPARCPHGHHWFAYELGGSLRNLGGAQFAEVVRNSAVRYTGWPPFWYPTRRGIAPYPFDDLIECWLGGDTEQGYGSHDAAHSDFWRISPQGFAFLLRGYQEDSLEGRVGLVPTPGTLFDLTLPAWRVGEVLLHAESLAAALVEGEATVRLIAHYSGLAGRTLTSISGRRILSDNRVARQDAVSLETTVAAASIKSNLPEIVHPMLGPLYSLFDFFQPPPTMVADELSEMRRQSSNLV